jgi:glycosyl-4,4'-diaponeurosporenoate acyltransferase
MADVTWPVAVAMNVAMWVGWSATVGWWQARRPWRTVRPTRRERLRPWERDGRWYVQRLGVRRWKHWLPEAGTWFGGLSKRHRPDDPDGGWERLAAECLRAERTHRGILWALPVFAVWNPWWLLAANVGFAVVANVPCWVVARSTRGRVEACRRRRPAHP